MPPTLLKIPRLAGEAPQIAQAVPNMRVVNAQLSLLECQSAPKKLQGLLCLPRGISLIREVAHGDGLFLLVGDGLKCDIYEGENRDSETRKPFKDSKTRKP